DPEGGSGIYAGEVEITPECQPSETWRRASGGGRSGKSLSCKTYLVVTLGPMPMAWGLFSCSVWAPLPDTSNDKGQPNHEVLQQDPGFRGTGRGTMPDHRSTGARPGHRAAIRPHLHGSAVSLADPEHPAIRNPVRPAGPYRRRGKAGAVSG